MIKCSFCGNIPVGVFPALRARDGARCLESSSCREGARQEEKAAREARREALAAKAARKAAKAQRRLANLAARRAASSGAAKAHMGKGRK